MCRALPACTEHSLPCIQQTMIVLVLPSIPGTGTWLLDLQPRSTKLAASCILAMSGESAAEAATGKQLPISSTLTTNNPLPVLSQAVIRRSFWAGAHMFD